MSANRDIEASKPDVPTPADAAERPTGCSGFP